MSPSSIRSMAAMLVVVAVFCFVAAPVSGQVYWSDYPIPFSGSGNCAAVPNPSTPGVAVNATCTCLASQ